MEIKRLAYAGTMESSDVYVEVEPGENGVELQLESSVMEQYGDQIRAVALDVIRQQEIQSVKVRIQDRGALDCVIRARVETALLRGKEEI